MSKKNLAIIIAAIIGLILLALLLRGAFSLYGGTPIIIKGDGGSGELSVSGLNEGEYAGKGDISTIRVTIDDTCWFYKIPDSSLPTIKLVTDNCNIGAVDELLSGKLSVDFDTSKFPWDGNKYSAKPCKLQSLVINPTDIFGTTGCSDSNGPVACPKEFKLATTKKLEVQINYADACPSPTSTPTPSPTPSPG